MEIFVLLGLLVVASVLKELVTPVNYYEPRNLRYNHETGRLESD